MKNILTALFLGILLAVVTAAQDVSAPGPKPNRADKSTKPRIAVIEFRNTAALPYWEWEKFADTHGQMVKDLSDSFIVSSLEKSRAAVRDETLTLNGPGFMETAVKVGKLLGVNYVLVGEVSESSPGVLELRAKLVELKGKGRPVIRIDFAEKAESAELPKDGSANVRLSGSRVMKQVIQKLMASLKAADL